MNDAEPPLLSVVDRDYSYTVEVEQHVIGGLLLDNSAWRRIVGIVTPTDFYRADHGIIFQQIGDLIEDDAPADVATVAVSLEASGKLEYVGGQSYLGALAANTPSAANIRRYSEIVSDRARARAVAALGNDLADRASMPGADIGELLAEAEPRIALLRPIARDIGHMDLVALSARIPEQPHFPIPDWAPAGYAVGLFGHGGAGKSSIALLLAVCMAAELEFAGIRIARRRVLYHACEDRAGVLHWRLARICAYLGISMERLNGWLYIIDNVGRDCVLWERDPRTGATETQAYRQLAARMRAARADVLIVDGISDTFAGNENARSDVKRYINAMVALIPPDTGFVLLLGHVGKPTAAGGATSEGYSGSTQWHNGVRARWYLYPETEQDAEADRPSRTGALRLELQKSNLGKADQAITWRWDDDAHLFLPTATPSAFDKQHQDRTEQLGIRRAMKACMDARTHVPAALSGPRTAYLVLSQRSEFPDSLKGGGRQKPVRFRRHIEVLRQMLHIEESSYRRENRHIVATLVLTTEGRAACV